MLFLLIIILDTEVTLMEKTKRKVVGEDAIVKTKSGTSGWSLPRWRMDHLSKT